MSEQKHVIKRQIIELTVPNAAAAPAIQDAISRAYRQRIVPLIDQYCDELGAPDRLYRIDALELDLGTLDAQNLEEEFVARVRTILHKELAAQITRQEEAPTSATSPKTRSALELFALFVRTGSLPWWADQHQPGLLAENLQKLLDENPSGFAPLLQTLLRDGQIRQRIVNQYEDAQLGQLCGLLVPAHQTSFTVGIHTLIATLQKTKTAQSWPSTRLRQSTWSNSLQVAALGGQQYATFAAFSQAVLERVAADLGRTLIADLHGNTSSGELSQRLRQLQAASEPPLAAAWAELQALAPRFSDALREDLRKSLTGTTRQAAQRTLKILQKTEYTDLARFFQSALSAPGQIANELAALLQHQHSRGGPLTEAWAALRSIIWRLPAQAQAHWLTVLTAAGSEPDVESILQFLNTSPSEHGLRPEERARLHHLLRHETTAPPAIDLQFSAAEEISIGNAGLVILWPFLTGFFTHLGLLDERNFKDLAARQRAVGLLQVLASGQASFPEYLLPLNKLLCGLALPYPFDFGLPLRKPESSECKKLLKAVIAQVPLLNNMSLDGFRGSFLLRPGLLSTRDGRWLLRVERQTFDIVLDRFPWSWQWVRLPWMETPLQVEW